ncbi:MAG: hypothetical protein EBT80_06940 [Chitinophagales bacterium]|nr:hypothetical protein [Chitinophagales bacterium]
MRLLSYISLFLFALCSGSLNAQTIVSVTDGPLYEIARRKQLCGDSSGSLSAVSFTVRPIAFDRFFTNAVAHTADESFASAIGGVAPRRLSVKAIPFQHLTQFNATRPLAFGDGALIPARGWQFYYAVGAELRSRNFLLRINPEYTWSFNADFKGFPSDHYPIIWKYYYNWLNQIDMPEMFSAQPHYKIRSGQSRMQFMLKGLALGISTENRWWGPGRFNALTLTNNAPGFFHYTFHTDKPLKTPVGTWEWQLIWGGRLANSNERPPDSNRTYDNRRLYLPKENLRRRFAGAVLTWQPRWTKGLFIGVDMASIAYVDKPSMQAAKMGSLFARLSMPKDRAELYFQYGRSDKFASPVNLLQDTIPRGYLAGLRKLFPVKGSDSYWQLGIEITQLQVPTPSLIRQARSWYTHPVIRHGFTNEGQVLGAPIGPGSNAQRLDISWVKNKSRVGIELERWLHNADFYYNYNINSGSNNFNRQWVDLMGSLVWNFQFHKWTWFGQLSMVRSINYQWKYYIATPERPETYFDNGWDEINLHGRIGFIHIFSYEK